MRKLAAICVLSLLCFSAADTWSDSFPLYGRDSTKPAPGLRTTGVVASSNGVLTATQVVASTFTGTFTGQDHTAGTGLSGSVYNGSTARTWTVDQTWLRSFMDADFATTGSLANYLPLVAGSSYPLTGALNIHQNSNGIAVPTSSNSHLHMLTNSGSNEGYDVRAYEYTAGSAPRVMVRPTKSNAPSVPQFVPNGTVAASLLNSFNPQSFIEFFGTDYSADSSNYQVGGIGHDGSNVIIDSKDVGTYGTHSPIAFIFGDGWRVLKILPNGFATFSGYNPSANDVLWKWETYSTATGVSGTPNYGTTTATTTVASLDAEGDLIVNSVAGNGSALTNLDAGDIAAGTLAVARGGTGLASYAVGDLIYASAATTLAKLAGVATGNVLISGGVTTAPAWGKVGLTTHVSGTLPVANGGTGATALTDLIALGTHTTGNYVASLTAGTNISVGAAAEGGTPTVAITGTIAQANGGTGVATDFTAGSIIFDNGTGFAQDNSNFFWDDSNNRLGLGVTSPAFPFDARIATNNQTVAAFISGAADSTAKTATVRVQANGSSGAVGEITVGHEGTGAQSQTYLTLGTRQSGGSIVAGARLTSTQLFRVDDGTLGTNGTAAGAGDVYIEDALEVDGSITALGTYSATVGATNRDLFIDNTGLVGYVSSGRVVNGKLNKVNERPLNQTDRAKLLAIAPKKYDRTNGVKDEIGLIAEDVAAVWPEIVSYKQDVTTRTVAVDDSTTATRVETVVTQTNIPETVNYSRLIVPMLDMIQKQQAKIDDLEARLTALEKKQQR